nr:MAG TPA: Protein of unknown function (DUF1492) [Caudoviricetes sp.]
MKLTRKDIANYKLLKVLLERDQRKLDRYIAKQPSTYSGKVYGSNPNFPYEPRGFTVGGCTDAEIRQRQEWNQKCREMEVKIQDDIRRLNELEIVIDTVIANAKDIEDKMILEYTKDGMSQQQIAFKLGMERSTITKRIKKYVLE